MVLEVTNHSLIGCKAHPTSCNPCLALLSQWPKPCKMLYNDTLYQFKKFTPLSNCNKKKRKKEIYSYFWIFVCEIILNSSNISPVGIERILLFSSAKDTDFYFQIPNQSCIPWTKTLSQALLVNTVSFIKLYILSLLFLCCFDFSFNLLCVCFALVF